MNEGRLVVLFFENRRARLQHRLNHALYHGEIDVFVEFNFHGFPHVLTLANAYVRTVLRLIRNGFDENFGVHGLGRNRFIVGNTLTATVVDFEMSDYGEREHDVIEEDEENEMNENNEVDDRSDPQSRI
jgi:hypothetical protein